MPDSLTSPSLEILKRLGLNIHNEPLSLSGQGNISEAANRQAMQSQPLWKQYGQTGLEMAGEGIKGLLGMAPNPDASNPAYATNALLNIAGAVDPLVKGGSIFKAAAGLPMMMGGLKNVAKEGIEEGPSLVRAYKALPAVEERLTIAGLNPKEYTSFDTMSDAYRNKTGSSILAHEMPASAQINLTNPTPAFKSKMVKAGLDPSQFSNVDEMSDAYFKKTGSSILASETPTNIRTNASGESMASTEALNRMSSMKNQGKKFVVYDRAGNMRPLIGPEAVDYKPRPGETYGVQTPNGFQVLENRGGIFRNYK